MHSCMLAFASVFSFAALPSLALPGQFPPGESADPGLGVHPNATGATALVTRNSGPNGGQDWLNSGIKGNGWTAPFLDFDSLLKVDTTVFYSNAGANCKQYDWAFRASGTKYNIDPIYLAIIAMQESSCNADAGAGGPTPGLMQVACMNYPDGQCTSDIAKNVDAGAHFLRNQLDASGNNAIKAFGNYNGWFTSADWDPKNGGRGLTESYPCSPEGLQDGGPQNLDYLQQTFNGWLVGLDPQGKDRWIGDYQCQRCQNGAIC